MSLANATGAFLKPQTPLQQLLEDINFQRTKEMRQMIKDDSGFVVLQGTTYWTDLFVRHFLFQSEPVHNIDSDDLLFFVRKKHVKSSSRHMPKYDTEIDVFRKDSRKLPIGDPDVDWEETVYLNMVIHQFDYTLTLAICTRTSPKELQVLRRHSQRVYASPSRRKMDTKGEGEEITYPHICFMVDNFDEVFSDILVRDGEMVCVELVANDKDGSVQGVIFLGSIRYDALKKVYDARQSSLSSKVAQRMSFGLFSSGAGVQTRCEFVRMKGPQGKGHAEMAVTKPKGSGVETPTSEPGFCATDMWDDWDEGNDDYYTYRHQRRLSDPSANLNNFSRYGWRTKNVQDIASTSAAAKARSENEGLDNLASEVSEIEAGDLRDDQGPAFSAKELKTSDVKTITTSNTPPPNKDQVNVVVTSPSSANSGCSNCFGSKKSKRWSSASASSSVHMSEIYCPTCEESSNETPACLNKMPNKNIKPQHKTILSVESELIVGKEKKYDTKKKILRSNINTSTDKNKKIPKKVDSFRKEKSKTKVKEPTKDIRCSVKKTSKTKIDKIPCNKIKNNVDTNDNGNVLSIKAEEYEIADDATSLNGVEMNASECEPKIAILSANDTKVLISVRGKEELPVVEEPLTITPEQTTIESDQSFPGISTDKLCHHFVNCVSLNSENRPQLTASKSEALKVLNTVIKKGSEFEDLAFYSERTPSISSDFNGNSNKSISPKTPFKEDSNIPFPIARNSTLPRMKKTTPYQSVYNKAFNLVPKRRTPDGTNIYYWCDLTKTTLKELDDGAHNPLWTSRGFTQTFHFWKENRRQQSSPLNAFLTYVTLPWWSIAKDLLDHRENPILTF